MAQGLRLLNDNGVSYFDTSKTTWNFVAYLVAPATAVNYIQDVPEIANFSEIMIHTQFIDVFYGGQESYIHTVTRNGTIIQATGGNMATAILILGR